MPAGHTRRGPLKGAAVAAAGRGGRPRHRARLRHGRGTDVSRGPGRRRDRHDPVPGRSLRAGHPGADRLRPRRHRSRPARPGRRLPAQRPERAGPGGRRRPPLAARRRRDARGPAARRTRRVVPRPLGAVLTDDGGNWGRTGERTGGRHTAGRLHPRHARDPVQGPRPGGAGERTAAVRAGRRPRHPGPVRLPVHTGGRLHRAHHVRPGRRRVAPRSRTTPPGTTSLAS